MALPAEQQFIEGKAPIEARYQVAVKTAHDTYRTARAAQLATWGTAKAAALAAFDAIKANASDPNYHSLSDALDALQVAPTDATLRAALASDLQAADTAYHNAVSTLATSLGVQIVVTFINPP